jgi:2-hydroxychromene-2-carboxylate isomerase
VATRALQLHALPLCSSQTRLNDQGNSKDLGSTLAGAGMLHALRAGPEVFRAFHDKGFERFWQRALDIEDIDEIATVLVGAGAAEADFQAAAEVLRAEVAVIGRAAEAEGVLDVPTFVVAGDLYWGASFSRDS